MGKGHFPIVCLVGTVFFLKRKKGLHFSPLLACPVLGLVPKSHGLAAKQQKTKVKNSVSYLEVSIRSRFLGSQSEMASFYDRVGELQLGGRFPIDNLFHSVSSNQPNNFNRPVEKSQKTNVLK